MENNQRSHGCELRKGSHISKLATPPATPRHPHGVKVGSGIAGKSA